MFLLPSFLCLDAPLVAVGWSLLFLVSLGNGFGGDAVGPLSALFFAVWVIYLADRLFDSRRIKIGPSTPSRLQFGIRKRRLLVFLLILSGVGFFFFSLARLAADLIQRGLIVGLCTGIYFGVFRIFGFEARWLRILPWKEFLIAACFLSGVILGAGILRLSSIPVLPPVSLLCLLLANCLVISHAEVEHDVEHDPAAFFAGEEDRFPLLIPALLFLSFSCGLCSFENRAGLAAALCLGSLGTIFVSRIRGCPLMIQALSDGVLLVPWLVLGCVWLANITGG